MLRYFGKLRLQNYQNLKGPCQVVKFFDIMTGLVYLALLQDQISDLSSNFYEIKKKVRRIHHFPRQLPLFWRQYFQIIHSFRVIISKYFTFFTSSFPNIPHFLRHHFQIFHTFRVIISKYKTFYMSPFPTITHFCISLSCCTKQ